MKPNAVLICAPALPGTSYAPGSIKSRCSSCNVRVWMAPSGQRIAREQAPIRVICVPCFQVEAAGKVVVGQALEPDQIAEIEAHERRN